MNKYEKSIYHTSLLLLTQHLCSDLITIDEYKSALTELCNQYRKDKGIKHYVK